MDTAKLKQIFTFLARFDLDNSRTRALLAGGCILISVCTGALAWRLYDTQRGDDRVAESQSVRLSVPDGEDNDVLGQEDKDKIYGNDAKRNHYDQLFSDQATLGALIPNDDSTTYVSPAEEIAEPQRPEEPQKDERLTEQEEINRFFGFSERQGETPANTGANAAVAAAAATAGVTVPTSDYIEQQKAEQAKVVRDQMISLGYNPDTGLPLSESPLTEEPESPANDGTSSVEEPNRSIAPRAMISRSGGVSSLDDEWSDQGGVSSMTDNSTTIDGSAAHPFEVMFSRDEKLTDGGRVTVRLLEDMMVDGTKIPENTPLTGICTFGGGRLGISVNALKIGSRIYTLNLEAYDTDGLKGLYCPQTKENKTLKDGTSQLGNILNSALTSGIAGYPGQIVSAGASVIQSASGVTTISVSSGYKFYLIGREEK